MSRDCYLTSIDGIKKYRFRIENVDYNIHSPTRITGLIMFPDGFRPSAIVDDLYRTKPNEIDRVIFNDPATIVIWNDGSKTVVKCQPGDTYDKELGLAMCICKKHFGNEGNYNEVFKKFIPEELSEGIKETELSEELPSIEEIKETFYMICSMSKCNSVCPFFDRDGCKSFEAMTDDELRNAYKVIKKKEGQSNEKNNS